MRGARWLLLLTIAVIVSAVGIAYRAQKKVLIQQALPKPAALPAGVGLDAEHWTYTRYDKDKHTPVVEIVAKDARQAKDSTQTDLTQVELKLHHQQQGTYDLIKSAAASFFSSDEHLYSEGEVDITLAIPDGQEPNANLTTIHSSGVTFDTNTGKAQTERAATFTFRNGSGKAQGASYDPNSHELRMLKNVEMDWHAPGPNAKPMKIEAASLYYHEATSEIWLKPWGRLTRENTVVEGYESVVHLDDKKIRSVETNRAQGTDQYPNRKLAYAADHIWADFNDNGVIEKIKAEGNARLNSASDTAETAITAEHVDMIFQPQDGQSVLSRVDASGNSVAKETPLAVAGRQPGETHVLRSDSIQLTMQPGGKEIAAVRALGAGTLEFLPNLPAQHHRMVAGKDFLIGYGAQNRLDTFRAKEVKTATDPSEDERKRNLGVTRTASRELMARFDPNSNDVSTIDQSGDFTYEEGVRRARAAKASFDSKANVMVLDGAARVSDDTGSTAADRIRMDQRSGDFLAEGNVKSMRLPDKGQTRSGMLTGDEPLESQARKMQSSNRNRSVHYEGDVRLWQGANRIQAATVDLDREKSTLVADGNVISNLWEQPKDDPDTKSGKTAATPILTMVRAPHMIYTDQDRLATYTGGVVLNRQGMQVKSRELHAYLAEEGADSRLVKALADGAVEIDQNAADRTRTGKAEHCEYYTENQKVVLRGGQPEFVDSLKGNAHGVELTYFANDDRLLVNGSPDEPAKSRIRRK